ncbi:MAG: hypothetical protein ACFBSD_16685 [Paracoccaceae bacterium]
MKDWDETVRPGLPTKTRAESAGALHPSTRAGSQAAAHHLAEAVAAVDAIFGEGYAKAHPELVASVVQAAAIGTAVETGRAAHESALETVRRLSRETNETILKLKPRLF